MNHELEAEVIIEAFNRFEVDYVVIGAFAAIAQAVPIPPSMNFSLSPSIAQCGRNEPNRRASGACG